jgi:hypothetical protein
MQVGRFFGGIHHVQIIGRQDVGCCISISTWYVRRSTLVVPVAGISMRCPVRGRRSAPPPVLYTSDKPAFSQECIISIPDRIPNFEHRTTRVHAGAIVQVTVSVPSLRKNGTHVTDASDRRKRTRVNGSTGD